MTSKLYKVLVDGQSSHGGNLTWKLPKGRKPGAWHEVEDEVRMCSNGLHLTTDPAVWWKPDCKIYEVEAEGVVADASDKCAAKRVRLLKELSAKELESLRIFSSGSHEVKAGVTIAYGSAQVKAYGSTQVRAYDSAQVKAYGSTQVEACGSAQVEAYGSAQVEAYYSAQVRAYDSTQVAAYDSAQVKAYDSAQVKACGSAQVTAYGSTQVKAWGSAQVAAYDSAQVEAYGSATIIKWSSEAKVQLNGLAVLVDRSAYGVVSTKIVKE